MRVLTGTSGFSYKQWKGSFYPEKLAQKKFLHHYSRQLAAVEINNTFYRMPSEDLLERWVAEVPDGFVFALKAPRRITHERKLADTAETVERLWRASQALGEHRGPFLFQLPPYLRKDLELLGRFLDEIPDGMRAAIEFRHDSWSEPEVERLLAEHGVALCIADVDGAVTPEVVETADFGYLRLRRTDYGADDVAAWAERLGRTSWREAVVFFKHEDEGAAPRLAAELSKHLGA